MYETMNQPIPDLDAYLARLGLDAPPAPTLDGLDALIWAHQTRIPFEDLNTSRLNRPVPLDIPALYDKIVARRRGGYCFELNALFARLLRDLGFDARQVFCRIVRGRDFIPPCLHEGIAVRIKDDMFFCDVGFGGPMPSGAVRIEDGFAREIRGEIFRMDRFDAHWWTLSRDLADGRTEAVLQFNTFPQTPQEFLAVNMKCATDPESLFVRQLIVNLRTPDGSASITGDTLTVRRGGNVQTTPLTDDDALRRALVEHFGIDVIL